MLNVYYTNANGLVNKMCELRLTLQSRNIDIACITETHFDSSLFDSEVDIDGYNCFRQDRNFKLDRTVNSVEVSSGGGSVIYVKNTIIVEKISEVVGNLDSVAVLLECNLGRVLLCYMYRSPSLGLNQDRKLLKYFESLSNYGETAEKVIMGDFNLTDVSWMSGSVMAHADTSNSLLQIQQQYMDVVHNVGFSWLLMNEVTRRRLVNGKIQENLLDQVLCSDESLINDFVLGPPLGKSDHVSIFIELNLSEDGVNESSVEVDKRNWSKVNDKDILKLSSRMDWTYSKDLSMLTVDEMWQELHGKLCLITEEVPLVPSPLPNGVDKRKMPWINSSVLRAFKAKNKAWAVFDEEPCRMNLNLALERQEIFEKLESKAKVKFERKLTQDLKGNCKGFYSYIRNGRKVKSVVNNLEKEDGIFTETDAETAECLSNAFSSVFVKEPYGPLPKECYNRYNQDYNDCESLEISEENVYHELKKLNIYKSMGPDNVHPKLLKNLAENSSFVKNLTQLYQKCVEECAIPSIWKTANVIALHKKGSKKNALNYRPVSLTCILCKIYEQFIKSHVLSFVESKLSADQHGFVNQKSCLSNILETVDTIVDLLEEGHPVDVFYFDFCKAFDSVPHYRLLTKLENYGITGPTLKIIENFLKDRTMRTVVRGNFSSLKKVLSGVPQGSVLGPLLFVLFINDLPGGLDNVSKLFADDLKLICNADRVNCIKSDLRYLEQWEQLWLLKFNASKCKVMHLNYNSNKKLSHVLDDTILDSIESEKDLGIFTDYDLDWKANIRSCIKDANKMIAWVTRNIVNKEKTVMLNIFKTLIRPKLEYCVQIWNPVACHGNWQIIHELESVQRRFTRLISDIGLLPYSERLLSLQLTTLAERRIRGDLIETFKIVNGLVDYGKNIFNVSRSGSNIITKVSNEGGNSKVKKLRNSFISERVRPYWNNLPVNVKKSESVDMFKLNLESYKKESICYNENDYWNVSEVLLEKIEGPSYLKNKVKHNEYLLKHPYVAKKQSINLM